MKVNANGININYESTGSGKCLVLIHGFSDNLTMWPEQVRELSKNYRILTYDVRGHGETETPEGDFSMELFADDLEALLRTLDIDQACVLGYSMGGRIALTLALKYPEKVNGLVMANSGIMDPNVQPSEEEMAEMTQRREQMAKMFESGDINLIAEAMAENSLSPGLKEKDPALFEKYKAVKLRNNLQYYQAIMQGMMTAMSDPPDLGQVKCPVLIIAGEHDAFMALDAVKSMEERFKDSTSVIFPTGHASAIEVPDQFNKAVSEFMERL